MFRNLLRQFASWRQDQGGTAVCASLEQFLEQRNAESCGFAAAGRSARKYVVAGQCNGNGRALDGGGLYILKVFDAAQYGSIQSKF